MVDSYSMRGSMMRLYSFLSSECGFLLAVQPLTGRVLFVVSLEARSPFQEGSIIFIGQKGVQSCQGPSCSEGARHFPAPAWCAA